MPSLELSWPNWASCSFMDLLRTWLDLLATGGAPGDMDDDEEAGGAFSSTVGSPAPKRPNLSPRGVMAEERLEDGLEAVVEGEPPKPALNDEDEVEVVGDDDEELSRDMTFFFFFFVKEWIWFLWVVLCMYVLGRVLDRDGWMGGLDFFFFCFFLFLILFSD